MSTSHTLRDHRPGLWRIAHYFWPHTRKYVGLIVGSTCALLAEVGLRLLEPWPLKFVFDRILGTSPRRKMSFLGFLDGTDPMVLLTGAALAVIVITGVRSLASYWQTIGFAQLGNRVLRKVRAQLYRHVQYLSLSFHTRAKTGDLVTRVINDVAMLQDVAVTALMPTLAKVLIVAGMAALMFWMNWQLALLSLCVLPLFWLRTTTLTHRIREVARKTRRQEGAMAATATESIAAIKTVQALALEETFAETFSSESDRNLKEDVKGKRLIAALERTVDVIIALATALVLWQGTRLVLRGAVSAGDLLVFLAYLKSVYRPIQDFAKYTGRLAKATAAGERVIELLERVPDVRDSPDAVRAPAFRGRVQFESVGFAYEEGYPVLDQIDLDVASGQRVAIVGSSGAGKSTLVSLILRLYDAQKGRVLIDGQDIRQFTLESLRSQIGVVLQDNILFATTVQDNIAFGLPGATFEQIEKAARLANAHDFIMALPEGYQTIVGERGVTFSHGQRQRIAIARAAIRRAPILILDEPTTGLDAVNESIVNDALRMLFQDRTTFVITHDLRPAMTAHWILYLEDGRVAEQGTHQDLLQFNRRYATLYRLQTESISEAGPLVRHSQPSRPATRP